MRVSERARIAAATTVLAAGLLVAGWLDYSASRRDLVALLVDQASSLRQAVAAAARAGDAAAAQIQSAISARLLDNARLLAELDRRGGLNQDLLDGVVASNRLFRVTVLSADGARELTSGAGGGPPPGAGRGFGFGPGLGQGAGAGPGLGRGPGAGAGQGRAGGPGRQGGPGTPGAGIGASYGAVIAERLLAGGESEAISAVHGSRWGSGWRLSAGVRRAGGGAIVLNTDANEIAGLQQQASIDHLLDDVATRVSEVAYVILLDEENRAAHGPLAEAALAQSPPEAGQGAALSLPDPLPGLTTHELRIAGTPVLEFAGPVDSSRANSPWLRLGLRLDGLRGAERRSLTRLVVLLVTALGLGVLTLAFVGLRREHGALRAEHARARDALRRRDRLAAMGELASTVAHEVRNPLNAIGMSVQRLRREFISGEPAAPVGDCDERRELLDVLASESERINRIVQQFLEYARPPHLSVRRADLGALLRDAVVGVEGLAASRSVRVDSAVPAGLDANVDPDQLKSAVDNLLRNAIEASPSGGLVLVRAQSTATGPVIVVEDAGPGIPPESLPRIFDLYFTTKRDGTGVGLAVTHRIIEGHGGSIEVDSEVGRGTRMIVKLPRRGPEEDAGE
ncbi:MAG: ATP-binding protein [Acidobacteriota bacterium]